MTEATFTGVRMARLEDEDAVYRLLMLLHAENALASLSPEKVRSVITHATRGRGGIIGVIDGPNGIEASIGLALLQWWYSDEWHLEEIWNFVHPDHRRSTHARRLVEFAKWSGDQLGTPVLLGVLTRHRLFPKLRLLQRQVPQVGALFLHGVDVPETFSQRRPPASSVPIVNGGGHV
jgi:hypothetical protein